MCSFYVYVLLFFDFSGFRECCQEFFHGFAQAVPFWQKKVFPIGTSGMASGRKVRVSVG